MTPAQVHTKLSDAGLAHLAPRILNSAKPAVQITPTPTDVRGTFSKFGGTPDLPPGVAWPFRAPARKFFGLVTRPRPLAFLAQIDLAAAAPHDTSGLLPSSGRLWFFYDINEYPWGFDPDDRDGWRVLYSPEPGPTSNIGAPPGAYGSGAHARPPFPRRSVVFQSHVTYPDAQSFAMGDDPADSSDRADEIGEVLTEVNESDSPGHRLLGHPTLIQNPMELECQLASHGINAGGDKLSQADQRRSKELEPGAADWILLLQLNSDDVWMWGDSGMLYFWIRKQDLAARDFSTVWLILQCF